MANDPNPFSNGTLSGLLPPNLANRIPTDITGAPFAPALNALMPPNMTSQLHAQATEANPLTLPRTDASQQSPPLDMDPSHGFYTPGGLPPETEMALTQMLQQNMYNKGPSFNAYGGATPSVLGGWTQPGPPPPAPTQLPRPTMLNPMTAGLTNAIANRAAQSTPAITPASAAMPAVKTQTDRYGNPMPPWMQAGG